MKCALALFNIFEESVEYGRPIPLGSLIASIFRLKRLVRRRLRRGAPRVIEAVGSGNAPPETDCVVRAMTRVSGFVMRHASCMFVAKRPSTARQL
jgi:hypothetical protein